MGIYKLLKATKIIKPLADKIFPNEQEKILKEKRKLLQTEVEQRKKELEYKNKMLNKV